MPVHALRRLLLLLLCPALGLAETYRVDGVNGDDANDGVQQPFKTIARGLQALQLSDTLVLTPMDEPYRESIPLRPGGTAAAPMVIDGGGATISGADPALQTGWTEAGGIHKLAQVTEVHFLFGPDCRYEQGKSPTEMGPEEWFWKSGELFFRPAAGKTPADYRLEMSVRISGIIATGVGQCIIRNLTAMHFYNDGFNIHNGSAPLWFENIRGVWNGDEGFSAHENCECYVRGAEFSHNYWHGINDIDFARTFYQNIVCRDNRSKGIWFIGGMHSVTDSEVSGSPTQVMCSLTSRLKFPRAEEHPLRQSIANFRSVVVDAKPNEAAVVVTSDGVGIFEHCLIRGGRIGVQVDQGGRAYLLNSIVSGAAELAVRSAGQFAADYNLYWPGRFQLNGTDYGPEQFAAYQQAGGNDEHSWVEEPKFIGATTYASRASHAAGGAHGARAFGGPDLGLEQRLPRPTETNIVPPGARALPDGGELFSYDFERENPWGRLFPVPETNQAKAKVEGTSTLSIEQAHGGTRSAKLSVKLPAGPPNSFNLKLFSSQFEYRYPVTAVKYWLYGDGSGRTLRTRLRDKSGECFYDAAIKIDWTGWREVAWDLTVRPPELISVGDGNQQQDVPPLEVVAEIEAAAGSEVTLYLDDLEVTTGTPGAAAPVQPAQPAQPAPPAQPAQPAATGALPEIDLPSPVAPGPPPSATRTADGRTIETYDFETGNLWGRLYPDPEQTKAGEIAHGRIGLSTEQAHGGTHSAKLEIELADGQRLKLFGFRLPYTEPVRAMRFWLYGDGSGRQFVMRVRDRSGEGFFSAPRSLDWSGWRQVTWDLVAEPPASVLGGDGNKAMDGPTMEVVLEFNRVAGETRPLVLYFDDLELERGG